MPNFSKGKIYKLVSNKSSDVYIGSCLIELSRRLSAHKAPSNECVSKRMFVDNAVITIVLIEDYACENKNQLKARELHYITTINCINKNKPYISDIQIINGDNKEWHKQYNESHKEQKALYDESHKEQKALYDAAYNESHKEQIAKRQAQYNAAHKERIAQQQKQYNAAHKEQIAQQKAQYYQLQKLKQSS